MIKKVLRTFFVAWLVLSLHALFYTASAGIGGLLLAPIFAPAILKARVQIICKKYACLDLPTTKIDDS